ncbi:DUF4145 domain-containing protein [Agrobacterium sp. 22-226-1]
MAVLVPGCVPTALLPVARIIHLENRAERCAGVNHDTPKVIVVDYHEAAGVMSSSPRRAAALLRLAVRKLCGHLGEGGQKGLDQRIQQALDALRVIGNEAVHPGTMDLNEGTHAGLLLSLPQRPRRSATAPAINN